MPLTRAYSNSGRRPSTRSTRSFRSRSIPYRRSKSIPRRAKSVPRHRSKSLPRRSRSERTSYSRSCSMRSMGSKRKISILSLSGKAESYRVREKIPTISITVSIPDLKEAHESKLKIMPPSFIHKVLKKRIHVEASKDGMKDFVFYAPEGDTSNQRATPTEFVKVNSTRDDISIVRRTDDFEITFVGMSVSRQDTVFGDRNGILLYSLNTNRHDRNDFEDNLEKVIDGEDVSDSSEFTDKAANVSRTSRFSLSPDDVPLIHYDPAADGQDYEAVPSSFIPIPASKSLYYQQQKHKKEKVLNGLATVSLRFMALEIDKIADKEARIVGEIEEPSKILKSTGIAYLQPLSIATSAASALGKDLLKTYSKPDHIMSKDLSFLLAEPYDDTGSTSSGSGSRHGLHSNNGGRVGTYGNFLRYGYYFFLSKKVEAKLYSQSGSSSQTVPLLMRRHPYTKEMNLRGEKEFFPLSDVSYVCMKVSPGCSRKYERNVTIMESESRSRLDSIFQMGNAIEMLAKTQKTKGSPHK